MPYSAIIPISAVLLTALLFCEHRRHRLLVPVKLSLSALFVLTAAMQPHPRPVLFALLFAGLVCCMVGDGCLALRTPRSFMAGLIAFLIGHIFYAAAFFTAAAFGGWQWAALVVLGGIGAAIHRWLHPHLGRLNVPVAAYITAISIMMTGAVAVAVTPGLGGPARGTVLVGAACFYLSDLFVARERFLIQSFVNRLVGLPLYYAGQFLLACSVGLL